MADNYKLDIPDGQVVCTAPNMPSKELQALALCVDVIERNVSDENMRRRIVKYLSEKFS